jgi:hypothetical protein
MKKSIGVATMCTYRPKSGKELEMLALLKEHWPVLKKAGLVTNRPSVLYRATNKQGRTYFVEIFEWKDDKASGRAHEQTEIMRIWEPLGALAEGMEFSEIEPITTR